MKACAANVPLFQSLSFTPNSTSYTKVAWTTKKYQSPLIFNIKRLRSASYQNNPNSKSSKALGSYTLRNLPRRTHTAHRTASTNTSPKRNEGLLSDFVPYMSPQERNKLFTRSENKSTNTIPSRKATLAETVACTSEPFSFKIYNDKYSHIRYDISQREYSIVSKDKLLTPMRKLACSYEPQSSKPYKKKLREKVLSVIHKLKQLNINPDEMTQQKILCTKPYEKPFSKEFILAVKHFNMQQIKKLLKLDKYLVYCYDYTHKTALHWAAIKGNYTVIECLANAHADLDAKDIVLKTPLYYASRNNDIRAVEVCV